ncbi:hypothetical protein LTR53_008861 [Teratosphaeriaceae sp. CCFEE 6253]|nr:hypothetical protein LTR53_008861 [Teratosphaeriaceae sp. CCFEE 6253]
MANTSGAIARITREIAQVQKNTDLSLAVAVRDSDVRHIRALIVGPPETPYEYGFFELDVKMPKDYPIKSPHVRAITTNGGRTRFNPNMYNEGKVCLSILGTWRGNPGEEWSSAQGLESVLLSIQSLMSSNPYENEPGHETAKKDEPNPKAYVEKIRHETLRIAVIQRMEGLLGIGRERNDAHTPKRSRTEGSFSPAKSEGKAGKTNDSSGASTPATEPSVYEYDAEATFAALDTAPWEPFGDLMKRRFLWYYDSYKRTAQDGLAQHARGTKFKRMEFEYPPNIMDGSFDYRNLIQRLDSIKAALGDEEQSWAVAGAKHVADSAQLAVQLAFQFKQLAHQWNDGSYDSSRLELTLPDETNPFVWNLTLLGKPMTNLDGGIWSLTLAIPPTFPDAQPRVRFETPIFHHRVSGAGTLCYFPKKEDEIASHLDAIVTAVEDAEPRYDPRAVVHPEAFALYWGGEEKRKMYGRKLRRSAQDSSEFPA